MNEKAFRNKVLPLNGKIFAYALSFLKNEADARDALQDIYLKLWKMKDQLDTLNSLEAFCIRITRNYCLDRIRLKKNYLQIEDTNLSEDLTNTQSGNNTLNLQKQQLKSIRAYLESLPEAQRTIMLLKDFDGYDYEEISKIMDLNINTIRVNLSRARKAVRKKFKNSTSNEKGTYRSLTK